MVLYEDSQKNEMSQSRQVASERRAHREYERKFDEALDEIKRLQGYEEDFAHFLNKLVDFLHSIDVSAGMSWGEYPEAYDVADCLGDDLQFILSKEGVYVIRER